ncbi:MAG: carboxypeptidase regulatory-like domain-containing protein [Gemmatimonadota bacterium]
MRRTPNPSTRSVLIAFGLLAVARPTLAQDPTPEQTAEMGLAACAVPGETLDGVVIDRATRVPLAGAQVLISSSGETRMTAANSRGRFRFCGVPASSRVELAATHSAVRGGSRFATGGNGGRPVTLIVDLGEPAPVSVMVTDRETGEPVDGVTVRLQPGPISAVTNEAGRAGLGQVPPGDYRLLADHLAFASFDAAVFVVPAESRRFDVAIEPRAIALDPLNVEIEAGECAKPGYTSLSGRVIDRRTKIRLPEALVSASRYAGDEGFVGRRAETDEDGVFIICGMPIDERVRLQARMGSRSSNAKFMTAARGGEGIVLEIDHGEPGFVVLFVTDASTGRPVEGAMIRLRPLPLGGVTSARGRAGFREVPPGEYEVRVDHFAYASFDGILKVGNMAAEEFAIPLQPTAIAVEPLEVKITGRDPYLLGLGFYDRMATVEEGRFYDYWDVESYYTLGTFVQYKDFMLTDVDYIITFVNGRPFDRLGYLSLNEIPFGKIRGVEMIPCTDLPPDLSRWVDLFDVLAARQRAGYFGCWARLIWRGERRVRAEREKPTGRCATERKAELECAKEGSGGSGDDG